MTEPAPLPQKPLPPYDSAELQVPGAPLKWVVVALKCGNCKHTWIGLTAVPVLMSVAGVAWKCMACNLFCGVPTNLPKARLVMHNMGLTIQLAKGLDELRDPKRAEGVMPDWGLLPGDPGFKRDEEKGDG